eukprot:8423314-Pyramimonas_sp.AAC.1
MIPVRLSRGASVAHIQYIVVSISFRGTSIIRGSLRLCRWGTRRSGSFTRGAAIATRRVAPAPGPTGC